MSKNVEEILEQLDDLLDTAWAMPLSGGKVVVDGERVRELLESVRAHLPSEIRQARAIVNDRAEIIDTAKKEAEDIIRNAEERRNQILSREEIVIQAQEMRRSAQEYTDDLLRRTEEILAQQVSSVRQARASLRSKPGETAAE